MNRIKSQRTGTRFPSVESLNPMTIARAFLSEPWSFKLTCLYVFLEYVRPQSIYSWLAVAPWSMLSILLACIAFVAEGAHNRIPKAAVALLGIFSVIVFLSATFATYPSIAIDRLDIYVNWIIAFFLIANTATTRRRWVIFVMLFLLWSLKMSQHGFRSWVGRGFSFASWGVSGAPGWFQNSGEFALQMGIFVPLSLYFIVGLYPRLSKLQVAVLLFLPISGIASIIGSSSRGGLLALIASGVWLLLSGPQKTRRIIALGFALPLIWFATPAEQKARFKTAGEDETSVSRLTYWGHGLEMTRTHPFLGVGYENWAQYYWDHYSQSGNERVVLSASGQRKVELAHNSFIEVASQLGVFGFFAFVGLIVLTFVQNANSRKILAGSREGDRLLLSLSRGLDAGTIAFIVAGSFMSVAFYPFLWFQLGMTTALNIVARDSITHPAGAKLCRSLSNRNLTAKRTAMRRRVVGAR